MGKLHCIAFYISLSIHIMITELDVIFTALQDLKFEIKRLGFVLF